MDLESFLYSIDDNENYDNFDLLSFSKNINLFDFQVQALKNAVRTLKIYFEDSSENKDIYSSKISIFLDKKLNYDLQHDWQTLQLYRDLDNELSDENGIVNFAKLCNRLSIWMATGSGKTVTILKLIEVLQILMDSGSIPTKPILFLTHRDDLMEQFSDHVRMYNQLPQNRTVILKNIRDFGTLADDLFSTSKNFVSVFQYRADLFGLTNKEKIIDFRNYENNGNWYLILDEAHKGDKEDSKRQHLFNLMSRNGFMFNFSATFSDERDLVTCAFNFNLAKFIQKGFGKHLRVSNSDLSTFRKENSNSSQNKILSVLQSFLLLNFAIKSKRAIEDHPTLKYHNPLLMALTNSVDTEGSDLEIFFKVIEQIASGKIPNKLFELAKKSLKNEIDKANKFSFENNCFEYNSKLLDELTLHDLREEIFNSQNVAKIEVLKIPGNSKEIVLKLQSSSDPFALIRIGDISNWLNKKLKNYQIIESYDNASFFARLNDNSSQIKLLIGSRSFYEGWDSNRPNVILFVNIGLGSDARRFVLQAIGRGVRLEPILNERKRLQFTSFPTAHSEEYVSLKNEISALETLHIIGTESQGMLEVVNTLKLESNEVFFSECISLSNDDVAKELLLPDFAPSKNSFHQVSSQIQFPLSDLQLQAIRDLYANMSLENFIVNFNANAIIHQTVGSLIENSENFILVDLQIDQANVIEIMRDLITFCSEPLFRLVGFSNFLDSIDHFDNFRVRNVLDIATFKERVKFNSNLDSNRNELDNLYGSVSRTEYSIAEQIFKDNLRFSEGPLVIDFKYFRNHVYNPICLETSHVKNAIIPSISHQSELDFLSDLEKYVEENAGELEKFDWWRFTRIEANVDKFGIPYFDTLSNSHRMFKPDFVFWFKQGKCLRILFVDPKGTEHSNGYRKIDGFKKLFKSKNEWIQDNGTRIVVNLMMRPANLLHAPLEEYREFWFTNIETLFNFD